MREFQNVVVFITTSNKEEAQQIARASLEQRRAACVNIVPGVDSLFLWEGEIDNAREVLLIIKTKASQLSRLIDLVKDIHPYEVPEVIALPIIDGNRDYLEWIDREIGEDE